LSLAERRPPVAWRSRESRRYATITGSFQQATKNPGCFEIQNDSNLPQGNRTEGFLVNWQPEDGATLSRCSAALSWRNAHGGAPSPSKQFLFVGYPMITLYSYPELFGVSDNNGYGLKVFAFLRLTGVPFRHEHIFDASTAPRGQLPYIVDDGETIGDSDSIIAHLITKYRLTIDAALTPVQRDMSHLITRMLDDIYWVMSYSRWKDERFWPAFRDALLRQHPSLTEAGLRKAQEFNLQRYHFQGIGRYAPDAAYDRGVADLRVLADLIPTTGYLHGEKPSSIDASIYGFIANIYFYHIETPLKQFVVSHENVVRQCRAVHDVVTAQPGAT
jgi:glutathione S-transferase